MKNLILIIFLAFFTSQLAVAQSTVNKTDTAISDFVFSVPSNFHGWSNQDIGQQGSQPNKWYVSNQERSMPPNNCGAAMGNGTLHISSTSFGDLGAAYDGGGLCPVPIQWCVITDKRIYSPNINTIGKTNIILSFNFIGNGQNDTDKAFFEYSINGGNSWIAPTDTANLAYPTLLAGSSLNNLKSNNTGCVPEGRWTKIKWKLPTTCENIPNLKIAFRWINNDDGRGTDPSFAVDSIFVGDTVSTGFETFEKNLKITFFSNPINEALKLSIKPENLVKDAKFTVYNSNGQLVQEFSIQQNNMELITKDWNNGIYLIVIKSNTNIFTSRFIIQH